MFHPGNGAGRDDGHGEFKPPAERRHVHGRGCPGLPATHLHLSGRDAFSSHRQVSEATGLTRLFKQRCCCVVTKLRKSLFFFLSGKKQLGAILCLSEDNPAAEMSIMAI